jgi:hypothetical protein
MRDDWPRFIRVNLCLSVAGFMGSMAASALTLVCA